MRSANELPDRTWHDTTTVHEALMLKLRYSQIVDRFLFDGIQREFRLRPVRPFGRL